MAQFEACFFSLVYLDFVTGMYCQSLRSFHCPNASKKLLYGAAIR